MFGIPFPRAPIQDWLGIDQIYPGLPGTFQEQLSVTFSLAVPFLSIIASGGSL
ncbi:hypothetical protein [Dietzia sp. PP-33]|jgi:hypothetical protein|uniref:hypothetical protein n=1 Tax=Dietzia sp. PP-33 TaxID=2957500 RepID=UPI0029A712E4|nr:hypothetical protein [Dietzia sp. PP-33]MDX2357456.1 hypothetical protein [Dietzia sp. PP-33]